MSKDKSLNTPTLIIVPIIVISIIFAYGFNGQYYKEDTTTPPISTLSSYLMMSVLALLGFGMSLHYFKYCSWSSIIQTIFAFSLNMILVPVLGKFWFATFLGKFNDNTTTVASSVLPADRVQFYNYNETVAIQFSFWAARLSLASTISLLVLFTGTMGRINFFAMTICSIIFSLGWTFCYYLNNRIVDGIDFTPEKLTVFDEYGTNQVFIFGSMFALGFIVVANCVWKIRKDSRRY